MFTSSLGERENKCLNLPLLFLIMWVVGMACHTADRAMAKDAKPQTEKAVALELEQKWGVKVEGVRLTAAGRMVDFRYRVINPQKAESLMQRGAKAYLVDKTTGTKLPIPLTKVGPLRGTGTKPQADRVYAVMFTNGGGLVQKGSKVTVVIGEFRAENLVVE